MRRFRPLRGQGRRLARVAVSVFVGVAFDRRGVLLVADDVGNAIWRVVPDPAPP